MNKINRRFGPRPSAVRSTVKGNLRAELDEKYAEAGLAPPKFSKASIGVLDFAIERAIEGKFLPLPEINKLMMA